MSHWAIDLGTTNTVAARWDVAGARPALVELDEVCRRRTEGPLETPRVVPSVVEVLPLRRFTDRLGGWPLLERFALVGRQALIGRPALDANHALPRAGFVPGFKRALGRAPHRTLARVGTRRYTARDVARLFVRELFAAIRRQTGERVRDLVLTMPVEAYEQYRAELLHIGRRLGVSRLRFLDEPVAAALGYGLGMHRDRRVLVVDFGGGTFHLALLEFTARDAERGRCRVVAKEGRPGGGDLVDRWLVEEFCRRGRIALAAADSDGADGEGALWFRLMLAEACRVKEAVHLGAAAQFLLTPPAELRDPSAALETKGLELTREGLSEVLEKNGLYAMIRACLAEVLARGEAGGIGTKEVDDVLMVGGSSLLPGVYAVFEEAFGRDRVRAWQPFEAVAYGAAAYAAGSLTPADFIVHEYAILTYDAESHEPQHTVVIPAGTAFPTVADFWKRQLTPTCSGGEPETLFKLVICEIGRRRGTEREFAFDVQGKLQKLGPMDDRLVVPLNERNPALGRLDPPHPPADRKPRLEIAFGVNEDRWLCATVFDLRRRKHLMKEEAVVRLL